MSGVMVFATLSCDKASELVDKAKRLVGMDEEGGDSESLASEVTVVGKEEGERIIAEEKRIVIVEYYSDT